MDHDLSETRALVAGLKARLNAALHALPAAQALAQLSAHSAGEDGTPDSLKQRLEAELSSHVYARAAQKLTVLEDVLAGPSDAGAVREARAAAETIALLTDLAPEPEFLPHHEPEPEFAPEPVLSAELPAEPEPELPWAIAPATGSADVLTDIRGIDEHRAAQLGSLGIATFRQLEALTARDVAEIKARTDIGHDIHRGCWIEQAAILATGRDTHFLAQRAWRAHMAAMQAEALAAEAFAEGDAATLSPIAAENAIVGPALAHAWDDVAEDDLLIEAEPMGAPVMASALAAEALGTQMAPLAPLVAAQPIAPADIQKEPEPETTAAERRIERLVADGEILVPSLITGSEPVHIAEPEPVTIAEPEPVIIAEPEPVIIAEPEPVIIAEPEPVIIAEPEPVIITEPESEPIIRGFDAPAAAHVLAPVVPSAVRVQWTKTEWPAIAKPAQNPEDKPQEPEQPPAPPRTVRASPLDALAPAKIDETPPADPVRQSAAADRQPPSTPARDIPAAYLSQHREAMVKIVRRPKSEPGATVDAPPRITAAPRPAVTHRTDEKKPAAEPPILRRAAEPEPKGFIDRATRLEFRGKPANQAPSRDRAEPNDPLTWQADGASDDQGWGHWVMRFFGLR